MEPVVVRPGEGEVVTDRPERTIRILFAHDLVDVTWTRYEPGERGPDPHVHDRHVDAFYVLEGELEFGAGPEVERVRAAAGTYVAVPPGVVHTFANESASRAVFLNVHSPSTGFADFLRGRGAFDSREATGGGRPLADAIVTPPGRGERLDRGDRTVEILGELEQVSFFDMRFDAQWEGVDPHVHRDGVDAFVVLEGEVAFHLRDGTVVAAPETFVGVPPATTHGFAAHGGPIRLLNLHAPDDGFAGRVRGR